MRGGRAASSVLQLYGEVQHETQQGSASGDTNSRQGDNLLEFGWLQRPL
jgi:hypothetical protein